MQASPLLSLRKKRGGIGYTATDTNGGNIIHSRYFSDQDLGGQGVGVMATKDIMRSKQIKKTYKSISVGHVKPDGKIYIAAATTREIDFTYLQVKISSRQTD